MKAKKILIFTCFILAFGCWNSLLADISDARNIVVHTIDNIYLDISTDYASEDALRTNVEQSVRRHLEPVLDFSRFTKLILASHWKKASVEQRDRFADILRTFLYRTLSKAIVEHKQIILSYQDDLVVLEPRPGRTEDRAIVSVVVENHSKGKITLDFRMGQKDGRWSAYDVIVQDVSFAINYRAILNSEIKKNGLDPVIESFTSTLEQ